jgi:hypothetical protein
VSVNVLAGVNPQVTLTLVPNISTTASVNFITPAASLAVGGERGLRRRCDGQRSCLGIRRVRTARRRDDRGDVSSVADRELRARTGRTHRWRQPSRVRGHRVGRARVLGLQRRWRARRRHDGEPAAHSGTAFCLRCGARCRRRGSHLRRQDGRFGDVRRSQWIRPAWQRHDHGVIDVRAGLCYGTRGPSRGRRQSHLRAPSRRSRFMLGRQFYRTAWNWYRWRQ